ncbi:glycerol kinase [Tropicibacter sp. R15_0]|uniref:FGGY-family carbohydrate kinase n=1 Tax=Tropicibacter sp. R15_0 TaxID=2821101 RepID=UPI001ADA616A|nr:FGGY family carbohydrate kinase [Tropicibacter sp. R15_0]MBO9467785.1 glycerol kinase [Tropicibacter sp. R15_0]
MLLLAIDQGTTNTKALVFDGDGQVVQSASAPCQTHYPETGWAEQSAAQIWTTTQAVINEACAGIEDQIAGIGITNQRETIVIWDSETGQPVGPAPIWQCRRTAPICAELLDQGLGDEVLDLTGLGINPLFPASKLAWLIKNREGAKDLLDQGRLRAGTVDSWLLWNLTGGTSFATDHSNASRTLLFDTARLDWSPRLAEIFSLPQDALATLLPNPLPSDSRFGDTESTATNLPGGIPIHAMMGDSHAALFGHGVRAPGQVKATYGTGSSLMALTQTRPHSRHGISGTIAWTTGGTTFYALEGNITVSAQAAAFVAGLLGIDDVQTLSDMASSVSDSDGVSFVPALAGLGAPHWDDSARGLVSGLHHGTTANHLARATFEAIAHQVCDVYAAMEQDLAASGESQRLSGLLADGGASRNGFLMQLQADLIGQTVQVQSFAELGAYGMAMVVAEQLGNPLPYLSNADQTGAFDPKLPDAERSAARAQWAQAISMLTHR